MNQGESGKPKILRNALSWSQASVMFRSSDSNFAARAGHSANRDGHSETDRAVIDPESNWVIRAMK